MASKRQRRSLKLTSPQDHLFIKSSRTLDGQRWVAHSKTDLVQKNLWEQVIGLEEAEIQVLGLDLSIAQDRSLLAIQILLSQTNYLGNDNPAEVQVWGTNKLIKTPTLTVTVSEYLDAYGLIANENGRYNRKSRDEAIAVLKELAQSRDFLITSPGSSGAILYTKPLIGLAKMYGDLTEEEKVMLSVEDAPKKLTHLLIECNWILIDRIKNNYVLKPSTMYIELDEYFHGKPYSPAIKNLINFLLFLDIADEDFRIAPETLGRKLRLDSYFEQRKKKTALQRVEQALNVAEDLGYLLEHWKDEAGNIQWKRNPERCKILAPIQMRKLKREASKIEN
jgi:hypothetical protein